MNLVFLSKTSGKKLKETRQHVDDNKNVNVDGGVDELIFLRGSINDLQDEKRAV